MTDRERAEKLVREHAPDHLGPVLEAAIEQALTTAREEGREQGRREEREECARIVDAARPCPVADIEQAVADDALRPVAAAIRARSDREARKAELRKVMDEISEDIARSGRGEG